MNLLTGNRQQVFSCAMLPFSLAGGIGSFSIFDLFYELRVLFSVGKVVG
jgi:hypothetical protein